ncbi:MAG: ComEC/Rec2 family competence protein [Paracoccaceae bacterium]
MAESGCPRRGWSRLALWPLRSLAAARGRLFPWTPVFVAFGIGLWFALPWEPEASFYAIAATVALLAGGVWLCGPEMAHAPAVAVLCLALGLLAAGARAHLVAGPMLDFRYYGPVTGRVVEVDRSQSDALRVTLDQVVLNRTDPASTPLRVRVSLHGDQHWFLPQPGQMVMMTATLSAPEGPAEPGGFDFRRMAFFDGLGAVGYTSSPVLLWAEAEPGTQIVNRLRNWLSRAMLEAMPGQAGAFATGSMTGDRSAITQETAQALRDSSLAHLLAISGMNMAFLVGFVFALVRYGLALIPPLALRVNTKKLAAAISLGVALFYLLLSGANVATERAFLMVAVMLGAVLSDRRALSLRSVAISALILLLWQPESLLEPGFQMSFAATIALVAGFGGVEGGVMRRRLPRWLLPVYTLVLSSALAGAATAPYAAAHFNRFADLGFVGNLLTVPAMGVLVMPGGAVAALLAPFGLAAPALWVMELGARWILFIAHRVAAVEGAVTGIPAPAPGILPVLTLGGLWVVLTAGRLRWAGVLPMAAAVALWSAIPSRPLLLVSGDGTLAGLLGPQGRALSAAKGAGFTAESWLENDGDLASQEEAAARPGFDGPRGARSFVLAGWRGVILSGKSAAAEAGRACTTFDLVIVGSPPEPTGDPSAAAPVGDGKAGCHVIGPPALRRTGPIALSAGEGGLILAPTRRGHRIWMRAGEGAGPMVLRRPEHAVPD